MKIIYSIGMCMLGAAIGYSLMSKPEHIDQLAIPEQFLSRKEEPINVLGQSIHAPPENNNVVSEAELSLPPNVLLKLQYEQDLWRRNHGYFSEEDYGTYASYDDEALLSLAKSGDLVALDLLATKLKRARRFDEAARIYMNAAVLGSTAALTNLSRMNLSSVHRGDLTSNAIQGAYQDMLMFSEIAAMYGDRTGIWRDLMTMDRENIVLTDQAKAGISARALDIFTRINQERDAKGLVEVDRSYDPLGDATFAYVLARTPNPNGWALQYLGK